MDPDEETQQRQDAIDIGHQYAETGAVPAGPAPGWANDYMGSQARPINDPEPPAASYPGVGFNPAHYAAVAHDLDAIEQARGLRETRNLQAQQGGRAGPTRDDYAQGRNLSMMNAQGWGDEFGWNPAGYRALDATIAAMPYGSGPAFITDRTPEFPGWPGGLTLNMAPAEPHTFHNTGQYIGPRDMYGKGGAPSSGWGYNQRDDWSAVAPAALREAGTLGTPMTVAPVPQRWEPGPPRSSIFETPGPLDLRSPLDQYHQLPWGTAPSQTPGWGIGAPHSVGTPYETDVIDPYNDHVPWGEGWPTYTSIRSFV